MYTFSIFPFSFYVFLFSFWVAKVWNCKLLYGIKMEKAEPIIIVIHLLPFWLEKILFFYDLYWFLLFSGCQLSRYYLIRRVFGVYHYRKVLLRYLFGMKCFLNYVMESLLWYSKMGLVLGFDLSNASIQVASCISLKLFGYD